MQRPALHPPKPVQTPHNHKSPIPLPASPAPAPIPNLTPSSILSAPPFFHRSQTITPTQPRPQ
ncbi:hypothetical protein K458DRAFT_418287 [Lentithecium fluviatile CBS 122367]|uniref:Uncharacterized protein n=1 Tax=Lentithecium fluviatile CBS 122367 TaxID=1168545 RepID=A0A6G1J198_9PLEO|nr:hypothetical protein K458DRAFT_418287 [Lentithecium fluviatile CBS 122367]